MEDSIALIKGLKELGFSKLIATPHIMSGFYINSTKIIRERGAIIKEELKKAGIEIEIDFSAEYYTDEHFEKLIEDNDLLPFIDQYILFELSFISPPQNLEDIIFRLKLGGYKPILAHPERYLYWKNNRSKFERLIEMGCQMQLNLLSLTGAYGPEVKKNAQWMLKYEMIQFAGTDTHNIDHINVLERGLKKGHFDVLLKYPLQNIKHSVHV